MSESPNKRNNGKHFKSNKFHDSVKCVQPNDHTFSEMWTAGDGFDMNTNNNDVQHILDNSCVQTSVQTSNPLNNKPVIKRKFGSVTNGLRNQSKQVKTSETIERAVSKLKRRYTKCLEENNLNIVVNDENEGIVVKEKSESQLITTDFSSPIKTPICDTHISPDTSPHRPVDTDIVIEKPFKVLINRNIFKYFDESIDLSDKMLKTKGENSLQLKASNVLKQMKKNRISFCHSDSSKTDVSKTLTLRIRQIETLFDFTAINAMVLNEENPNHSQNSKIILILSEQITEDLVLNSGSLLKLFPNWTEKSIDNNIIIINAFNIQLIEEETNPEEDNSDDSDSESQIIWQNEKP